MGRETTAESDNSILEMRRVRLRKPFIKNESIGLIHNHQQVMLISDVTRLCIAWESFE